jgi:4-amino-4-deoxy-L-arabinose transferase-like glycosyltransferase
MSKRPKIDKFLVIALALIFLLSVGVRVSLILISPKIVYNYGTISGLGETARNLAEGRGYVVGQEYAKVMGPLMEKENGLIDIQDVPPPAEDRFVPFYYLPPGTSALLAGTYLVFGQDRYIYLRYLQAIIDSLGCVIIFLIGRELFSRRAGLIAALLYAVWLPIAFLAVWPLHDALMPFITLVALYLFILGVRRKSIIFYVLSGLAVGIGCYFQPSILLLPVMFGIGMFVYNFRKREFRNQIADWAKVTVIMMAVVTLVISPWVVRNHRVTGDWIGMRPGVWSGIWEGFGEFGDNPVGAQLSDSATYELAQRELDADVEYLSPEYQAFFKGKVLKAIEEHPVWWLGLLARRVPRAIFYANDIGINNTLIMLRDMGYPTDQTVLETIKNGVFWKFTRSHPAAFFYVAMGGLLYIYAVMPVLLSLFGIWVLRKNWRVLALILTVTVYFAAVHIVFFTATPKSIMPGSLAYIILCAVALDYCYSRIKDRDIWYMKFNGALAEKLTES